MDSISWKRADGRPIRSGAWSLSDFNRRITIHNVRQIDAATYECVAHYVSRDDSEGPAKTHVHRINVSIELGVVGGKRDTHTLSGTFRDTHTQHTHIHIHARLIPLFPRTNLSSIHVCFVTFYSLHFYVAMLKISMTTKNVNLGSFQGGTRGKATSSRTQMQTPVLEPRHQFPLGSPAFPLFLFCETTTDVSISNCLDLSSLFARCACHYLYWVLYHISVLKFRKFFSLKYS